MSFPLTRIAPALLASLPLLFQSAAPAQTLPNSPSALVANAVSLRLSAISPAAPDNLPPLAEYSSSDATGLNLAADPDPALSTDSQSAQQSSTPPPGKSHSQITATTGTQPHRILGLMPNYRSVSAGEVPPPPGFKQSFKIATHQALDYSTFIFLGLTTASAYWTDSHPSLDTWNGGNAPFYAYLWRGFLDKTDQTYQSAWILPTMLHEDTRYYAMGHGSKWKRLGYAMSRIAVAKTYSGHNTINLAGLGGKAGAQAVSTYYYPPSSESFGVLATKFGYSCARDVGFTVFREFYPDIAIHVLHRNP